LPCHTLSPINRPLLALDFGYPHRAMKKLRKLKNKSWSLNL